MRIANLGITLAVILFVTSASAQDGTDAPAAQDPTPVAPPQVAQSQSAAAPVPTAPPSTVALELDDSYREARRTRLNGILLTAVGVPASLLLAGVSFYFWAAYTFLDIFFDVDGAVAWGVVSIFSTIAAVALLSVGAALWAVGNRRMRELRQSRGLSAWRTPRFTRYATDPFSPRGARL